MDSELNQLKSQIDDNYSKFEEGNNWHVFIPCGVNMAIFLKEFKLNDDNHFRSRSVFNAHPLLANLKRTQRELLEKLSRSYLFFSQIQSVLNTIKWEETKDDTNEAISKDDMIQILRSISEIGIFLSKKLNDENFIYFMSDGYAKFSENEEIQPFISNSHIEKITSRIKLIFEAYADENQKMPPQIEPITYYTKF